MRPPPRKKQHKNMKFSSFGYKDSLAWPEIWDPSLTTVPPPKKKSLFHSGRRLHVKCTYGHSSLGCLSYIHIFHILTYIWIGICVCKVSWRTLWSYCVGVFWGFRFLLGVACHRLGRLPLCNTCVYEYIEIFDIFMAALGIYFCPNSLGRVFFRAWPKR